MDSDLVDHLLLGRSRTASRHLKKCMSAAIQGNSKSLGRCECGMPDGNVGARAWTEMSLTQVNRDEIKDANYATK